MTDNRTAATSFEGLANELERFAQLDLGPSMWRGLTTTLEYLAIVNVTLPTRGVWTN